MKKRKYETPAMKLYDMLPTQILAGSEKYPGTGGDGDQGGYASLTHPYTDGIMA
ncbi:MAG: hypothetical protein ACI4BA_08370 [Prevotella sp.]